MRGGDPPRHPFWLFPAPARFTPGGRLVSFPLCARCTPAARLGDPPSPAAFFSMPALRSPSLRLRPAPSVVLHGLWAPRSARVAPRPSLFVPSAPCLPLFCPLGAFQPHRLGHPPPPPGCAQSSPFPGKLDRPFFRRPPIPNPRSRRHLCRRLFPANPTDPFPSCPPPIPNPPLLSPLSCRRRFPATFLPSRSPTPTGGSPVSSFSLLSEKEGESREAFPRIFVSLQP